MSIMKRLLNISIILLSFHASKAQKNFISINFGMSYRLSDKAVFGYNTADGRHSDLPGFTHGIMYGRKIVAINERSSFYAIGGYQRLGIIGKKLYYKNVRSPIFPITTEDPYYRKYALRLQNIQLGLAHKLNLTDKINVSVSLVGNYLFRNSYITYTEYVNNNQVRTFSKSRWVSSVVPDSTYNRLALIVETGIEYQLDHKNAMSCNLGSFVTDLRNKNQDIFPVWFNLGYKYNF